jgi:hypothetical protein
MEASTVDFIEVKRGIVSLETREGDNEYHTPARGEE